MVQWLRLYTSNSEVSGFILGWGTKIPYAVRGSQWGGRGDGEGKRHLWKNWVCFSPPLISCLVLGITSTYVLLPLHFAFSRTLLNTGWVEVMSLKLSLYSESVKHVSPAATLSWCIPGSEALNPSPLLCCPLCHQVRTWSLEKQPSLRELLSCVPWKT